MYIKRALVGFVFGASVCTAMPAFADQTPVLDHEASGKTERSYYNDAEKRAAHAREVGVISTESYEVELGRDRVRRFYLVPELGMEIATVGARIYTAPGLTVVDRESSQVAAAPAFGVQLGWRLGHFNVGARYQGAIFTDNVGASPSLNLNKIYAEIGFNTRKGVMIFSGFLAGGYAFAVAQNSFTNGAGGKAGVSFDFLVNRFFTLGPGVSFDVHAYRPGEQTWNVAYGGTAFLRLGFQI